MYNMYNLKQVLLQMLIETKKKQQLRTLTYNMFLLAHKLRYIL